MNALHVLALASFLCTSTTGAYSINSTLITSIKVNNVDYFEFIRVENISSVDSNIDLPIVSITSFEEAINQTGWSSLTVASSAVFSEHHQAYWSGFLEANITRRLIEAFWNDTFGDVCPQPTTADCKTLEAYLRANMVHMLDSVKRFRATEPFWHMVELALWQLKGISDALSDRFVPDSTRLTDDYLSTLQNETLGPYLLQLSGDLSDITSALNLTTLKKLRNKFGQKVISGTSCSALIKLTADNQLFLSHVTWSQYSTMLRVLKQYNFPWKTAGGSGDAVPGFVISFTSYPGVISSIDDFYLISSGLWVSETTTSNTNAALWSVVRQGAGSSVLSFIRVMVANRLARSGREWVRWFSIENSGTYNNQWMVFDAKLFEQGKRPRTKGVLTVAEQMPGIIVHDDMTHVLASKGYWPSYNIPYFPRIYNMSGFVEQRRKHGDWYDYHRTPRAKIFRRDQARVTDLASMYRLMRYNDFRHDPLSRCNCTPPYTAGAAISSRDDLNDPNGTYPFGSMGYRLHGGTDVKVANLTMMYNLNFLATSGPTYSDVAPFQWSKLPLPVPRPELHPDKWMFTPIVTNFSSYGNHVASALLRKSMQIPVF